MNEKLTAYALNELPPDERAALEAQLQSDADLRRQAEDMRRFCELLEREVRPQEGDALDPAQRTRIIETFERTRATARPSWRRPMFLSSLGLAAAACLAVMLTWQQAEHAPAPASYPATAGAQAAPFGDRETEAAKNVNINVTAARTLKKELAEAPKAAKPIPAPQPVESLVRADAPTLPASPPVMAPIGNASSTLVTGNVPPIPGPAAPAARGGAPAAAAPVALKDDKPRPLASAAPQPLVAGSTPRPVDKSQAASTPAPMPAARTRQATDNLPTQPRTAPAAPALSASSANETPRPPAPMIAGSGGSNLAPGNPTPVTVSSASGSKAAPRNGTAAATPADPKNSNLGTGSLTLTGGSLTMSGAGADMLGKPAPTPAAEPAKAKEETLGRARVGYVALGDAGDTSLAQKEAPGRRAMAEEPVTKSDFFKLSTDGAKTPTPGLVATDETAPLSKAKASETATYRPIVENPFNDAAQQPLSTFSLDADTASYANVRRFLNAGQRPPPDAVRLEELINYFPYAYEAPGKDHPVAVRVDLAEAPWQPLHRIARVAVKARDIKGERPAANFVFLLDVSGSMKPAERLPLIKQSLGLLVDQLRPDDHVAIVTYAGESGVALESTPGSQKEKIRQAIDKLNADGSTNGASGIRLAYEQAALNFAPERINRVILCTDGDFNVGVSSVGELEKLIAEKAGSGVFLSVLGVGTDNLHDHTMQALADRGNGNYHYLDSPGEARKVLVEQMTGTLVTVAKDVKLQVEFNPAQVAAYRLIGYEKRALATADFNNDRKDAGDIGAGHTVTALYEIVPAHLRHPDGRPLIDELKYAPKLAVTETPAPAAAAAPAAPADAPVAAPARGASHETLTVKLRYKEPDGTASKLLEVPVTDARKTLEQSDKDFQFAASVAGFGLLLRGSPHAGELTWETVRRLALAGKGPDEQGWRGEFIQLIEKARGLSEARH